MRNLVGGNSSTYIHKLKTAPTVAGTTYNTQQCRVVPWPIRPFRRWWGEHAMDSRRTFTRESSGEVSSSLTGFRVPARQPVAARTRRPRASAARQDTSHIRRLGDRIGHSGRRSPVRLSTTVRLGTQCIARPICRRTNRGPRPGSRSLYGLYIGQYSGLSARLQGMETIPINEGSLNSWRRRPGARQLHDHPERPGRCGPPVDGGIRVDAETLDILADREAVADISESEAADEYSTSLEIAALMKQRRGRHTA